MIQELSAVGKLQRQKNAENKIVHDSLKDEVTAIDLIIKEDGAFVRFEPIQKADRPIRPAEFLPSKKGKARLLLDKAEEVLCYGDKMKKHELFMAKLNEYRDMPELQPVFDFYEANKKNGVEKALDAFDKEVNKKERIGNIAFRLQSSGKRFHELAKVYEAIIKKYEAFQKNTANNKVCSICGKIDYPVVACPHGMIRNVPDGQKSGCALVSFNADAYESYGLKGNDNASVCTNCARTYVEGLNWLLSVGHRETVADKRGKEKDNFVYEHRKNFGSDTAMLYWTKALQEVEELNTLEQPDEGAVRNLIDAVFSGEKKFTALDVDQFYSCCISGSSARIVVRDWIELKTADMKRAIATWFKDIAIGRFDFEKNSFGPYYSRLSALADSAQNKKDKKNAAMPRVALYLWKAALEEIPVPMWVLSCVLRRIRVDKKGITPDRAALIRLIVNRNGKGGSMMKESLDTQNNSTAYICGRIFCVLEGIQRAARGKEINAGIRDRFFSSASTTPSAAFGRLLKLSQNHLSKIRNDTSELANYFDHQLADLFSKVVSFPLIFTLEEQGQFAIGYYHHLQHVYKTAAEKKIKGLETAYVVNAEKGE